VYLILILLVRQLIDPWESVREVASFTSERPLCHDSSTSANDVGAAEVYTVKRDKMVMTRNTRNTCIVFIF
jgi:hypothetical protein